jgi:hypothetical protein
MASGAIVRKPLDVRPTSHRTLAQRLALRIPSVARWYTRALSGLPLGSRLRRELMWRFYRDGVEAFNRADFDVLLLGVNAVYEVHPPREFVDAGFAAPCYRGRDGYRDWVRSWDDVWGKDLRLEPIELIDLGGQFLLLAHLRARGERSGVQLSWEWASLVTLKDGRAARDDVYNDHREALAAAGLSH